MAHGAGVVTRGHPLLDLLEQPRAQLHRGVERGDDHEAMAEMRIPP